MCHAGREPGGRKISSPRFTFRAPPPRVVPKSRWEPRPRAHPVLNGGDPVLLLFSRVGGGGGRAVARCCGVGGGGFRNSKRGGLFFSRVVLVHVGRSSRARADALPAGCPEMLLGMSACTVRRPERSRRRTTICRVAGGWVVQNLRTGRSQLTLPPSEKRNPKKSVFAISKTTCATSPPGLQNDLH